MLKKEFIDPHPMGFTNTVTCTSNGVKTIYVSGQVGYADGRVGETFEEQVDITFANLGKQLQSAGATFEDVVKVNVYVVDLDSEKAKAVSAARKKVMRHADLPASTLVGVTALVMKELWVEVEATAVVDA